MTAHPPDYSPDYNVTTGTRAPAIIVVRLFSIGCRNLNGARIDYGSHTRPVVTPVVTPNQLILRDKATFRLLTTLKVTKENKREKVGWVRVTRASRGHVVTPPSTQSEEI